MTDVTVTTDNPQSQPGTTRAPDGTILDQSPASTTHTPEQTTDGDSFLTKKEEPPKPAEPAATKPEAKAPDATAAPEKYTDFKLPDGYQFDKASLDQATTLFKEAGLSQDAAQKMVDFYAANSLQAAEAPYKEWANLQKQWTGEIADRFPGEKSTQVRSMISNVIDSTLPPSLARGLRTALDITGAGSHPDVVEALSILLKPLSEGTPVRGNAPAASGQRAPDQGPPSIADALYGHLRK